MGASEIAAFLTWLALERHVSASTQNQALSAVLFLYRDVPFVRDATAGRRLRHPHGRGATRSRRRQHDHDLHARTEPRRAWRAKPARSGLKYQHALAASLTATMSGLSRATWANRVSFKQLQEPLARRCARLAAHSASDCGRCGHPQRPVLRHARATIRHPLHIGA